MKALNRKEVLVNAKANGTLDSFKPLTRDEAFTKKALGLGGGASSWNDLTDKPFGDVVEWVSYSFKAFSEDEIVGFPAFAEGDTVTIIVNDVKHTLVAYRDDGSLIIGDSREQLMNGGVLGWQARVYYDSVKFGAVVDSTVQVPLVVPKPIDTKYLPTAIVYVSTDSNYEPVNASMYVDEIRNLVENGVPVIACKGRQYYELTSLSASTDASGHYGWRANFSKYTDWDMKERITICEDSCVRSTETRGELVIQSNGKRHYIGVNADGTFKVESFDLN